MSMQSFWLWFSRLVAVGTLVSCSSTPAPTNSAGAPGSAPTGRLQTVLGRGQLKCGISGELPGFSFLNPQGQYSGLDVEVCRAIAAALFDKPDAVEYRQLNAKERFIAVQAGEIDILSRNTTWTLSRDIENKLDFGPVVFYDGQGMMVRQSSGIKALKDFQGKAICTQSGTTNEQNLADQMRKLGVQYKSVVFEDVNATYAAYAQGRCEGITSDNSQLISRRTKLPKAEQNIILPELLSQEPLAPAVSDGDAQWSAVVRWVVYALIQGESLGITSKNVGQFSTSTDPVIRRFLGQEGDLGKGLGLPKDFAARVIRHVGNYGEVYDRNLGPKTALKLERGLNKLSTQGGLMFAPPFR
jgi:general L-amino acid transport system substrate-binding protein